jgi:phage terminase small subunit
MTKQKATSKAKVKAGTSRAEAAQKRLAFVEAFLANGGNASQAAIEAGYSAKTAGVTGAKMLKDPRVKQLVSIRKQETIAGLKLSTERTLLETARLAFSDIGRIIGKDGKVLLPHELDDDTRAAVSSFKIDEYGRIEYKFWDKNTASERLFKHQNLYKENNEGARPLTQVAVVSLVPLEPLQAGNVIDAER